MKIEVKVNGEFVEAEVIPNTAYSAAQDVDDACRVRFLDGRESYVRKRHDGARFWSLPEDGTEFTAEYPANSVNTDTSGEAIPPTTTQWPRYSHGTKETCGKVNGFQTF
jgi:hypothetical protein